MEWSGKLSRGPDGEPIQEITDQRSGITYHTWADAIQAEDHRRAWARAWELLMKSETR